MERHEEINAVTQAYRLFALEESVKYGDVMRPILCRLMNIRAIPPEAVRRFIASLPPLRREKVLALREERKQLQSLAAGLLARRLLASIGLSDTLLQYEGNGKPFIRDHPEWHISLSHSGELAVCVLSRAPVAVDIQKHVGVYESVLRTGYAPAEQAYCAAAPDRERAFYDLWCRKECKAKLRPYAHLRDIDALTPEPGFQYWERVLPGYSFALYAPADCVPRGGMSDEQVAVADEGTAPENQA